MSQQQQLLQASDMDVKGWMLGIRAALGMVYTPDPRLQQHQLHLDKIIKQIDGMGTVAESITADCPITSLDAALENLIDLRAEN